MVKNSLVSVIIPFLNPGSWLGEAIESVVAQTYTEWEILLIDDGSAEEDILLAQAYVKRFPGKIFYLSHPGRINKGLPASRNLGIANAKGVLVAFLDADDCWMPLKLERQLNLFTNKPAVQMICEASLFWYSWQDTGKKDIVTFIGAHPGEYSPPDLIPLLYPFGERQPPCPSGIIIRREALLSAHGFEEAFSGIYQLYEDQAFLFKIYCTEIIYISEQVNNMYRKRENSMSSAADDPAVYNTVRIFFVNWAENYLRTKSGDNSRLEAILQHFKDKLGDQNFNRV